MPQLSPWLTNQGRGTNAITQRPSGTPAQAACQAVPSAVAASASIVPRTRTKGLILVLGTMLALAATALGTAWHAAWAGVPLGLCVIAFVPLPWFVNQGLSWGIREKSGNPETTKEDDLAYVD